MTTEQHTERDRSEEHEATDQHAAYELAQKQRSETPESLSQAPDAANFTRRAFLQGLLAATGGGILAACAPGGEQARPFAGPYNTATAARVLASPRAPTGTTAPEMGEGTPEAADGFSLEQFLVLSAVLTGVEELSPELGRVYMQSLQASDEFDVTLDELYRQAGFVEETPPSSIEALQENGLFESEATSSLSDKIIEYWYTGVYTTPEGESMVATYVDALAWKALNFTKPNSICGSPGFWEERPGVTTIRD